MRIGTRHFYRMSEVWLDHVPLTRELEPSVYIPFDVSIQDCTGTITKYMLPGPILDKYSASQLIIFETDKCHISSVEITDATTGVNLITGEYSPF